jgi:hypothetical protein
LFRVTDETTIEDIRKYIAKQRAANNICVYMVTLTQFPRVRGFPILVTATAKQTVGNTAIVHASQIAHVVKSLHVVNIEVCAYAADGAATFAIAAIDKLLHLNDDFFTPWEYPMLSPFTGRDMHCILNRLPIGDDLYLYRSAVRPSFSAIVNGSNVQMPLGTVTDHLHLLNRIFKCFETGIIIAGGRLISLVPLREFYFSLGDGTVFNNSFFYIINCFIDLSF